jgi:hypothetical protein
MNYLQGENRGRRLLQSVGRYQNTPDIPEDSNHYSHCHNLKSHIISYLLLQRQIFRDSVMYVGFEVSTAVVMKSIIFWDIPPCSLLSCNRHFGGTYRLHLVTYWFGGVDDFTRMSQWEPRSSLPLTTCLLAGSCWIISSTLLEAICSSETSVATQQTTQHHIPEDDTLHVWICQMFTTDLHNCT